MGQQHWDHMTLPLVLLPKLRGDHVVSQDAGHTATVPTARCPNDVMAQSAVLHAGNLIILIREVFAVCYVESTMPCTVQPNSVYLGLLFYHLGNDASNWKRKQPEPARQLLFTQLKNQLFLSGKHEVTRGPLAI